VGVAASHVRPAHDQGGKRGRQGPAPRELPDPARGTLGRIKGNFFTTNLESVRGVFESVPWVRRASVRREWPNQLIVALEEHEALGTWGEDGRLLSVKGDVFTANLAEAEDDHELPAFSGRTAARRKCWPPTCSWQVVCAAEAGAGKPVAVEPLCVDREAE
jgi:hypothetical protein